jgi:type I restriction enzyme S subunit
MMGTEAEKLEIEKYQFRKEAGLDWVGNIPKHWKLSRIKNICGVNERALSEETDKSFCFDYVDIGSVTYEAGIFMTEAFTFRDAPSRARRKAKENDTIVSTVRTYLKAIDFISKDKTDFIYSTGFAILSPKISCIDPRYFNFAIKSELFTNQVDRVAKGMSYPAINSSELSRLTIPIPPIDEQSAIAQFLDRKTALIDKAIAIKEKQIELLKERRQILIHKAVTRGLNPNVKLKDSGVEWIGKIPAHWKVKCLKFIANLQSGDTISSEEFTSEGYPVFGGNGFRGYTNRYTNNGEFALIGRQGALCGNVNYAKGKFFASEHAIVVYPLNNENVNWLGETIKVANFNKLSQSAAQPGISVSVVKNVQFPYPSIKEQLEISEFLSKLDSHTVKAISLKVSEIEKLKEYKSSLINSAVTGKIRIC